MAPQIAGLQAANVDIVLGFTTPSYTALSQLVALRTGFEPQWFYSNVGSDATLVGTLLSEFRRTHPRRTASPMSSPSSSAARRKYRPSGR